MATYSCAECRVAFQAKASRQQRFCSRACAAEYHRRHLWRRAEKRCLGCDRTISAQPSRIGRRKYCSYSCAARNRSAKWLARQRTAKRNKYVNDLAGKASFVREQLLRFIPDKCLICGWAEDLCDLHHKNGRHRGGTNRIDNITILCPNCHREVHEGLIGTVPTIADKYPELPAASRLSRVPKSASNDRASETRESTETREKVRQCDDKVRIAPEVEKKQRGCGICGKAGHYRSTCLEARRVRPPRTTLRRHSVPGRPGAKLTWREVRAIRQVHARGKVTGNALAKRYGVSPGVISLIVNKRAWIES
jgi:hypothetical protein